MRRRMIPLVALVAIAAACASDPGRRYVQYADAYTFAVDSVADAVEAGQIKPEAGRRLQTALKIVRRRIDQYREMSARGDTLSVRDAALDAIEEAIAAVMAELAKEKQT